MSHRQTRPSRLPAAAAGLLCAVAAVYLGGSAADARRVAEANDLGRAGKYAAAASTARLAIDERPADGRALLTLARALERQGRLVQAASVLRTAAQRYPNEYDIHLRRAVVLAELNRDRAAAQALRRALVLNPLAEVPAPFAVVGDQR